MAVTFYRTPITRAYLSEDLHEAFRGLFLPSFYHVTVRGGTWLHYSTSMAEATHRVGQYSTRQVSEQAITETDYYVKVDGRVQVSKRTRNPVEEALRLKRTLDALKEDLKVFSEIKIKYLDLDRTIRAGAHVELEPVEGVEERVPVLTFTQATPWEIPTTVGSIPNIPLENFKSNYPRWSPDRISSNYLLPKIKRPFIN